MLALLIIIKGIRLKNRNLAYFILKKETLKEYFGLRQTAFYTRFNSKVLIYFEKKSIKILAISLFSVFLTLIAFYRFGLLNSQDPNTNNYNGIGWFLQNSDAGGWLHCAERLAAGNTLGLSSDGFTQWCLRRPGYVVYLGALIKIFGGYSHFVILFQLYVAIFLLLLLLSKVQKYSKLFAFVISVYMYKIFQMFGGSTLTEMLGIPAMTLAIYLLIVACETKRVELFGLALFTFAFASNARPFNSALPFLALILVFVLLKRYSLLSIKSLATVLSFFSIGIFFFETWRLIGYTDANHGLNSWVSAYSFVKGDPAGWSVAYRDFPNVNSLVEIEYFKMIQYETVNWFLDHPLDWVPIFMENIKSYLGAGGTYSFLPSFQIMILGSIAVVILSKSRQRDLRSVSLIFLAIIGSNITFAGILWPNEGGRISIPSNILVLSLFPLLIMINRIETKKLRNEISKRESVRDIRNYRLTTYVLCGLLISSSLGWKMLPKVNLPSTVQKTNNFCGSSGFDLISTQSLTVTGSEGEKTLIPLTLDGDMTMSRNSISNSLSEGDSRFFLSNFAKSDYQIRRMLYVNNDTKSVSSAFGIDTKPTVKGCWEPIINLKVDEIDRIRLLNIGVTHYSKK